MTYRQMLTWEAWLEEEWNRPSRADYYAMRIAQAMAGKDIDRYRIKFKRKDAAPASVKSEGQLAAQARAMAAARFGFTIPVGLGVDSSTSSQEENGGPAATEVFETGPLGPSNSPPEGE